MVNSKKMKKSTVAVILLSLLLCLSLILTATGAWFTDTKTTTDGLDTEFGTVQITSVSAAGIAVSNTVETTLDKLMPGSTISGNLAVVYGGNAAAYIRYKVSFEGAGADYITCEDADSYVYTTSDECASIAISASVSEDVGNAAQGLAVKVVIVVEALQQANTTGANSADGAWADVTVVEYTAA